MNTPIPGTIERSYLLVEPLTPNSIIGRQRKAAPCPCDSLIEGQNNLSLNPFHAKVGREGFKNLRCRLVANRPLVPRKMGRILRSMRMAVSAKGVKEQVADSWVHLLESNLRRVVDGPPAVFASFRRITSLDGDIAVRIDGAGQISVKKLVHMSSHPIVAKGWSACQQWGGPTAKSAGRVLDGRTWDQYPETRAIHEAETAKIAVLEREGQRA